MFDALRSPLTVSFRLTAGSLLLIATAACGAGPEEAPPDEPELRQFDAHVEDTAAAPVSDDVDPEPGQLITLLLETREGTGSMGFSFSQGMVPAAEADLVLSSWDCGARGRWVTVDTQGPALCQAEEGEAAPDFDTCSSLFTPSVQVGGSHPSVEIDGAFYARAADGSIYKLIFRDRTETPFEWFEAEDLSFEVVLEVELMHPAVRCRGV